MKNEYDIAIVGGGYAGLSCARVAASRGLKTLVLDRKKDFGEKIRTTGILVGEAAEEVCLPDEMKRKIPGVKLYAPNGKTTELHSPDYAFWAVDTPSMMRWMGKQAELNGAEMMMESNVVRIRENSEAVTFKDLDIKAKFAVGADGARSNFARALNYPRNSEFLIGAEEEHVNVAGVDPRFLHVFVDKELAPGYIGWVVPGVGVTQIGVAVRNPQDLKLQKFIEKMKSHFDFSNAECVEKRGGLIPCGGATKQWYKERSLLLGDAAGWVSPLTAGGIYPALRVGKAAGGAVADFLSGEIAHPAEAIKHMAPNYRSKQLMRWGMDHLQPPNWMMNKCIGNPIFERVAQAVFFHHRGFKDLSTWKAMFTGTAEMSY